MSQNFIKVLFNYPHVSSQPIKTECLEISSKYFLNFRHVSSQPIKSESLRMSFFQFFPSRPFNQIQSGVSEFHQIILQTFSKFPSQPMKTECLRISSKYFFKIFSTGNFNQIQSDISEFNQSIFFSKFPLVSSSPTKTEFLTISCCFFSSLSLFPPQMTDYNTT